MTRHIRLSEREYAALTGDSEMIGSISDFTGITELSSVFFGITAYKCSGCGRPCMKNGAGVDITEMSHDSSLAEMVLGKELHWPQK